MTGPLITYSAKIHDHEKYDDTLDLFAGTYTPNTPVAVDIRIWNNKYGVFDVEDLKNFALNFYFSDFEDKTLLEYLRVTYNNLEEMKITVSNGIATGTFYDEITISGKANNGEENDRENYVDLLVEFDIPDKSVQLKNEDMKSLFVEIIKL